MFGLEMELSAETKIVIADILGLLLLISLLFIHPVLKL
jgi:hypothetical protein